MAVREKRITCGRNYQEVDIYNRPHNEKRQVGRRVRKKVTQPKQLNLNEKQSKRYFVQLGNGNFGEGDYHVTLTYKDKYLPNDVKEAEKEVRNFFDRLKRKLSKKEGDKTLKYILVTEHKEKVKRMHHHIILSCNLTRDEIENMWCKGTGKKRESIGFANADRIQVNENGIEALCMYMAKDPAGRKRWSSSRNLKRPEESVKDNAYSSRKIEKLANSSDQGRSYFEKKYPKHDIVDIQFKFNEFTGWSVYLKMWRKKSKRREYE